MKKMLFGMLAVVLLSIVAGTTVSCTSCGNGSKGTAVVFDTIIVENDYDGVLPDGKLVFEHVVSSHREQMYTKLGGGDYTWYESHAILMRDIDDPEQDGTLADITSVFAVWPVDRANYAQYITTDWIRGTWMPEPIPGLWIGDNSLNEEVIKITFEEAYQNMMKANCVKPHDKNVTLRCPVGPKKCNPQFVFGNIMQVVFVDAVTGEVKTYNPAFEVDPD